MVRRLLGAIVVLTSIAWPAAELSRDQWQENLAVLAKELPSRHPNLFFHLPRAEWEARAAGLSKAIPSLSDGAIRIEFMKLVGAVGDGHTRFDGFGVAGRFFYLGFREFPDGLYIIDTISPYARAMGARVVSIDGMPIGEVRRRVDELFGAENDVARRVFRIGYLSRCRVLKELGVIRDEAQAEFVFERDGQQFSMTVKSLPPRTLIPEAERPALVSMPDPLPLWLKQKDVTYWKEYLPDSGTLYIQYNSCKEDAKLPFAEFTNQVVEKARETRPRRLVIDLRNNGGGNSEVSNPLLDALKREPSLSARGGRFVLIGEKTFSSGELVALRLKRDHHAMLVGEPTAQKPNSYGDVRTFSLPHGDFSVMHSTKHFDMMRGSDPSSLMPDRRIELSAADYFAGRDPVLAFVESF